MGARDAERAPRARREAPSPACSLRGPGARAAGAPGRGRPRGTRRLRRARGRAGACRECRRARHGRRHVHVGHDGDAQGGAAHLGQPLRFGAGSQRAAARGRHLRVAGDSAALPRGRAADGGAQPARRPALRALPRLRRRSRACGRRGARGDAHILREQDAGRFARRRRRARPRGPRARTAGIRLFAAGGRGPERAPAGAGRARGRARVRELRDDGDCEPRGLCRGQGGLRRHAAHARRVCRALVRPPDGRSVRGGRRACPVRSRRDVGLSKRAHAAYPGRPFADGGRGRGRRGDAARAGARGRHVRLRRGERLPCRG